MSTPPALTDFARLRDSLSDKVLSDTQKKRFSLVLKDKNLGAATQILFSALDSITSFITLHDFLKQRVRTSATGAPTDAEQDLLRAMLLFAGAGLDSAIKQLLKDAYKFALNNPAARAFLENHVASQMRDLNKKETRELLTDLLLSNSPLDAMSMRLTEQMCSESLQSTNQLFKVVDMLGADRTIISSRKKLLDSIFLIRQQIAHEMDIDMALRNRKRRRHQRNKMLEYSSELVITGFEIMRGTLKALSAREKHQL